jgi:predicted DNA-binding ribbon-helix-helix protein
MTAPSLRCKDNMPALKKRSISLQGHLTSLALEPEFWSVLDAAAEREGISLAALVVRIDGQRGERALASACRVYALAEAQRAH